MVKIAPSILAADFSRLAEEVQLVEEAGADMFHFDIMDGQFVPNLSFGPLVVQSVRDKTTLPFEVHLMVDQPDRFIRPFVHAGADMVTFHVEGSSRLFATIGTIRSLGKKVGLALNPATLLGTIDYLLDKIDMLLIMTVDPGFGGQKFIQSMVPKIREAREMIDDKNVSVDLAVDGGIDSETAPLAVTAGADVLVSGSTIFRGNLKDTIAMLKRCTRDRG